MGFDVAQNKVIAIGNGVTSVFSFPYLVQAIGDLSIKILKDDGITKYTLLPSLDFTVTGFGRQGGVEITLVDDDQAWLDGSGLRSGYKILIKRVPAATQETDFKNAGPFFPETHEDRFDRQTMIDLKYEEALKRAPKFDEFSATEEIIFPEPVANTFVAYDETGTKLITRPLEQSSVVADWPDITNKPATITNIDTIISDIEDDIVVLENQRATDDARLDVLEAGTGVNLGSGIGIFGSKSGANLQFKSITQPIATTANEELVTSNANNIIISQPIIYRAISQAWDSSDEQTYLSFLVQCISVFGDTPINLGPQAQLAGRLKAYWIERNDTYTYNGKTFISDREGDYAILRRGVQVGNTFTDFNAITTWFGNNRQFNTVYRLPDSHRAAVSSSTWGTTNWLQLPNSGGTYGLGNALETPQTMGGYLFKVIRLMENGVYKFSGFAKYLNQGRLKYAIVYRSNLGGTWTTQTIGEAYQVTAVTLQPQVDFDGSEIAIFDIGTGGITRYDIQLAFWMETAGTSVTTSNRHGIIPTSAEEFGTETATENFTALQNYITNMQLKIQKTL